MKKNISAVLLALSGLMAISSTAFADGPVGRTVNGVVRAGEDIVDGAGDAVSDVVGGVTSGVDEITGDNDSTLAPGDTDTPADNDSTINSEISTPTSESGAVSINNSGALGGISVNNPTTGVTYGLTAGAAVLAAIGIAVTAVRKDK